MMKVRLDPTNPMPIQNNYLQQYDLNKCKPSDPLASVDSTGERTVGAMESCSVPNAVVLR